MPEVNLRATLRAIAADHRAGVPAATIAARFHNTLVNATVASAREAAAQVGRLPVVLSGGVFQNSLLSDRIRRELSAELTTYLHGEVPPGDGGIALGQAVAADAMTRANDHREGSPCA